MRISDYRAWDLEMEIMCRVVQISWNNHGDEVQSVKLIPISGRGNEAISRRGNEIVLMRYSGLMDDNGVGIYEDDILESSLANECAVACIGESGLDDFEYWGLYFQEGGNYSSQWRFSRFPITDGRIGTCRVIGNVYEDPEVEARWAGG